MFTRALAWGLPLAAGWLVAVNFSRELGRRRRRAQHDGLDGLVSLSSRKIAAARAVESARGDAVILDPLAKALAGTMVSEAADGGSAASAAGTDGSEAGAAGRKLPRLIIRTLFFDSAVLCAVGGPGVSGAKLPGVMDAACHAAMASSNGAPCRQVVLLGSGMDTRPWRLELPPGVAWFEVDRADVLSAKRKELTAAGAVFSAAPPAAAPTSKERADVVAGTLPAGASATAAPAAAAASFPLKAATWAGVVADLQQPGWTGALRAAGYRPDVPTVWVAEGLLYYMQPDTVPAMLQEARDVSAPGSWLGASMVTLDVLQRIQQRLGDAAPQRATGSVSRSIMAEWKWGCPTAPKEYFGKCGWDVHGDCSWPAACRAMGFVPDITPEREAQSGVGYVLATV